MILVNGSLQESMGRAARETAQSMSWDAVAGQLVEIYHELADYRNARELA